MDNNLDLQYALDADIETAFDSFVDAIYDEVMNDEMKTTIISLPKHQQMKFVYSVLKHFAKGTDAVLSYKLCEPFRQRSWTLIIRNGLPEPLSLPAIQRFIL